MKDELVNPFDGYGGTIKGERFIGREEAINAIRAKIINSEEPGNIAIIGMPRIGKSSLIWNALEEIKEDLITKKLLPIWVDASEYVQKEHLFCAMVNNCANELEDLGVLTAKLNNLKNQVLDEKNTWFSRFNDIKRFFRFVKNEKFNVIILIDEFDNTEKIFQGSVTGFQKLRTLYNNPKHRIYYVIASRRKIVDIENTISIPLIPSVFLNQRIRIFLHNPLTHL